MEFIDKLPCNIAANLNNKIFLNLRDGKQHIFRFYGNQFYFSAGCYRRERFLFPRFDSNLKTKFLTLKGSKIEALASVFVLEKMEYRIELKILEENYFFLKKIYDICSNSNVPISGNFLDFSYTAQCITEIDRKRRITKSLKMEVGCVYNNFAPIRSQLTFPERKAIENAKESNIEKCYNFRKSEIRINKLFNGYWKNN